MLDFLFDPQPVPILANEPDGPREKVEFPVTVSLFDEQPESMDPLEGLRNLQARYYPLETRDVVPVYGTSRDYTGRIKFTVHLPMAHSGQIAQITSLRDGDVEQSWATVNDVEHDGDNHRTTLLVQARFDRDRG